MDFKFKWIIFCAFIFDIVELVVAEDLRKEKYKDDLNKIKTENTNVSLTYGSNNTYGSTVKRKLEISNLTDIYLNVVQNPDTNQTNSSGRPLRKKRSVFNLYNMISCATDCNPLMYKGYGCYCGFLGSGYPVDGIDRCCEAHDWCYYASRCPSFLQYLTPYYWDCYFNRPFCAIHHGSFGGPGSCASILCECDRVLSECLKQFRCPSSRAVCKSSTLRLFQNTFMNDPWG